MHCWSDNTREVGLRKLLRTMQVHFPALVDAKFALMRSLRNAFKIPFEKDFNALALFPDDPNALYLDVGANRGQSTDAILMRRKSVRLCLFEPNELLFSKLKQMYGGHECIVIHDFGLGDDTSEGVLLIPYYRGWVFDGLASFDREAAGDWLKRSMYFYDDHLLKLHESNCRIRRLDELHLAPFFIKLDIQGYEYKALKGAERTIRDYEPVLLIETPGRQIKDYLKGFGYESYAFNRGQFIPGATGSLNTFFMTGSKAHLVEEHIEKR